MLRLSRTIYRWLRAFGVDPLQTSAAVRSLPGYLRSLRRYKRATTSDLPAMGANYPVFRDRRDAAGGASGHYFHMDLWAARKIFLSAPERHVDIGSRIDGFIAHLLTFREVEVIDIRPLRSAVPGLKFTQGDASNLQTVETNSIPSLSCLHAAEHFGLGRYGDTLEPGAYRKFFETLARVLRPGGRLYLAVPIGRERVEFNAHRVFHPRRIVDEMAALDLVGFSAVNDNGDYVLDADLDAFDNAEWGCGLYEFVKPS